MEITIEVTLLMSYRSGVRMGVESRTRKLRLGALFAVILGDSILLNLSYLYDDPFSGWVLIGIPAALLLGFAGSIWRHRLLRVVGWLAVWLFVFAEIVSTVPGEEYTLGGPRSPPGSVPHLLPKDVLLGRFLLFAASAIALILCYWWAGRPERQSADGN